MQTPTISGERMRAARERAKMSRAELAAELCIGISSVTRIERGEQVPSANVAARWARVCHVSLVRLYEAA